MNINFRWVSFLLLLALVLWSATVAAAGPQESKETTAAEVRKNAAQTYESLKDYTVQQRDKAVSEAKEELGKLDHSIDEMQRNIDEHWQDMSAAARKKTRKSLDMLRQKREETAEWLGGLKHSSAEAWDEVKKGFSDSYDRLERAVKNAAKEFDKEN